MIQKLKVKFVCIIMAIMTVFLVVLFCAINITMFQSGERELRSTITEIANHDGKLPFKGQKPQPQKQEPFASPNRPIHQSSFFVKINAEDAIFETVLNQDMEYTQEDIELLTETVLNSELAYGKKGTLRFLVAEKPYGKIIVFLDNSLERSMLYRLVLTSLVIGGSSLIAVFFIALYLSGRAIKPVQKAFDAQHQFVADASHELKTPLTVIATNADVLQEEIGDNKWLTYIQEEVKRMSLLVHNLLYLAKSDNHEIIPKSFQFNLSDAVLNICLPFESLAFESSQALTLDIEQSIFFQGDESKIKQVMAILLDNAIKHTQEGGKISVSLKIQGSKKMLTVFNTGQGIAEAEQEKIFQRFYRSDSSRARETGGYGLGLAIAKAIITTHGGKIMVESEFGKSTTFQVMLP